MKKEFSNLNSFLKDAKKSFEEMLSGLVEIPTVSADPERRGDMERAASLASQYLQQWGAFAEVHSTSGNPVVVGRFCHPGALQTLTIYNHLDVQPADEPEWKRNPFVFHKEGNKYFGRGSTDDKGPALTALLAARYAAETGIPLNIQFVWEMEEEIGSPNFEGFMKKNSRSLLCDSVMVVDSVWISRKRPSICFGIRGNLTGSMILKTADGWVHSGITGGVARNPITELCAVATECYDYRNGKVLIPGFYDKVEAISPSERKNFDACGFDLKAWSKAYGLKRLLVQNRETALAGLWCRPTFEVHGISGGYTGPKVKTAIPPSAELKFSCRLAPRQDPEVVSRLIARHVYELNPDVQVNFYSKLNWYKGSITGFYAKEALRAMQHGFSRQPAFVRSGGSDGAIVMLDRYLKVPILLLGLSLPEHGYHAPNEFYDWGQAAGGVKAFVHYFSSIANA